MAAEAAWQQRRRSTAKAIPRLDADDRGWSRDIRRQRAGLKVNAFAAGLDHPRWIEVLPNGDVLAGGESDRPPEVHPRLRHGEHDAPTPMGGEREPHHAVARRAMATAWRKRARCSWRAGTSRSAWRSLGDTVLRRQHRRRGGLPYAAGADRITAPGRKLVDFKSGGHWTRSLLPSPDGRKLYAGVGSLTNIAENGMAVEEGRAAIYELDLAERQQPHLRLRSAQRRSAWPGSRRPVPVDRGQRARRPGRRDAARLSDLGARRRLLRLALLLLGADGGRSRAAGSRRGRQGHHAGLRAGRAHRVARPVLAAGGHASRLSRRHGHRPARLVESAARSAATSWCSCRSRTDAWRDRRAISCRASSHRTSTVSYGRPVGVTIGADGHSLLMADDVGDVIWRVTGA